MAFEKLDLKNQPQFIIWGGGGRVQKPLEPSPGFTGSDQVGWPFINNIVMGEITTLLFLKIK